MKVVIINNDLRVYWKGRLIYLQQYLLEHNISLEAIELFGEGSPYDFDSHNNQLNWWTCLFPTQHPDELSKKEISSKLFNKLNSINPDIIIASSIVFYAGGLGMQWAKTNKKRFIMFDDIKPIQVKRNFLVQFIKNSIIKQADALWVPDSSYDKEYETLLHQSMLYIYGLSSIDNNRFRFSDNKQLNNNVLLCVARLVPVKNIDNLLRAWQIVEQSNKVYKLVIIGNGKQYNYLNNLAAELNLINLAFLGNIDNADAPSHYYYSDAFILPSLLETWGLVVNEAMAAGLPVILSDKINAANSLLKENINGYSFEPLNVKQMAGAILKYINKDAETKQKMSDASFEIIKKMSYENMGDQLLKAIYKINSTTFKNPNLITKVIINNWHGKYNTSLWENV